jgi:fructokinase
MPGAVRPAAYAGIELGGTKILCRLEGARGGVLTSATFATAAPRQAIAAISEALQPALGGRRLAALGVASFGPIVVDSRSRHYGRLLATPKPGWSGFDLRRALLRNFRAPIVIDTDVNAAALAEQQAGAGRGCASLAYLTVGTGIGAGLALAGQTLKGALHPEAGHMRLRRRAGDTHLSTCPFHPDCAEGLAAGPAIARRLSAGRTLAQEPAVRALVAEYLGELMANLTLAWSPQRIVAGGGVMSVPGLLEEAGESMRETLSGYGAPAAREGGYLKAAQFQAAGLEGALSLARQLGRPLAGRP